MTQLTNEKQSTLQVAPSEYPQGIRSEEVEEILSVIPHWIFRWGITSIFMVILLLLSISWFLKYPDSVSSQITLTMANPAVNLMARSNGKLSKIFVRDKEWVSANTIVAAIENATDLGDYLLLKKTLDRFDGFIKQSNETDEILLLKDLKLGGLQSSYSTLLQNYQEYQAFIQLNYYPRKIKSIEDQKVFLEEINKQLTHQKELLQKEIEFAEKNLATARIMFDKKIVSEIELSTYESTLLQKRYALESSETQISNNLLQMMEHENTILDLNQQYQDQKRKLFLGIQESFKLLQSAMAIWEQDYVLRAPIEGYVSFFKFWSENQFIHVNDEVMSILPSSQEIIGKIELSGLGSGKVKTGQKVRVRFDSYPPQEYGMVLGNVLSVSQISKDNRYLVTVTLSEGVRTNYGKLLEFKQGMSGIAEITTEDLRLFERVFSQLKYIFIKTTE